MAPHVTNELTVTYGAEAMGGANDWMVTSHVHASRAYGKANVRWEVTYVGAATGAAFTAEMARFETAMTKPRQRLQVTVTGAVAALVDYNPAGGVHSGFSHQPRVETGDRPNTLRSRRYSISVDIDLPADLAAVNAGEAGLLESDVDYRLDSSRIASVHISGVYTALGGNTARAQYEAEIPNYRDFVFGDVAGALTFDPKPFSESAIANIDNTRCRFSLEYHEIIQDQSGVGVDDTDLINPQLTLDVASSQPGDAALLGQTSRPVVVSISFSSNVDANATTDLRSKWRDDIRPEVINVAVTSFELGEFTVVDERESHDYHRNIINASLVIEGVSDTLVESVQATSTTEKSPNVVVPAWGGGPLDAYRFGGHGESLISISTTVVELDETAIGSGRVPKLPDQNGIIFMDRSVRVDKFDRGLVADTPIRFRRTEVNDLYRFINLIEAGSVPEVDTEIISREVEITEAIIDEVFDGGLA
jgi:hypothetical protein